MVSEIVTRVRPLKLDACQLQNVMLLNKARKLHSNLKDFVISFVAYAFEKHVNLNQFKDIIEAKNQFNKLLGDSISSWWTRNSDDDFGITELVDLTVKEDNVVVEENMDITTIEMFPVEQERETYELVYVMNSKNLDDMAQQTFCDNFLRKRSDKTFSFKPVSDDDANESFTIMPELENPDIFAIRNHDIKETLYGAHFGCYWWAQCSEKLFLQVNLSHFTLEQGFEGLNLNLAKNSIVIRNAITQVVFMVNNFSSSLKDYDLQLDYVGCVLEIVANKVVPGYWEKCFVSEPTPLKFFSDLEFRDWKLKKEKNGVNPYDQVILVDECPPEDLSVPLPLRFSVKTWPVQSEERIVDVPLEPTINKIFESQDFLGAFF